MRTARIIMAGLLATGAVLTAPAQAKNSESQKGEDKSASSSSCSAYQQAPDGSWEQLPCKETGERDQPQQTQHKSGPQGADQGER